MADRIAFLQHSATDVPGVLGAYVDGLGLRVSTHRADHGAARTPRPGTFDLLVVLGSVESVSDPTVDWLPTERRLVEIAVGDGVPVLGVCFGSQLLAEVLGGTCLPGGPSGDRLAPARNGRSGGCRRPDPGSTGTRTPSPALRVPRPWPAPRCRCTPSSTASTPACSSTPR